VYVKEDPPAKGMSNGTVVFGSVVDALCTTVMPLIAVVQSALLVLVASEVFCR